MRVRDPLIAATGFIILASLATGCGSSHDNAAQITATTTSIPDTFTGCNLGPPIPISQKGDSELLLVFGPGTTATEMDAVANNLFPMTRAGVESGLASGLVFVGAPTCTPPELDLGYRSSLSSKQFAALQKRLLAEPHVSKLEPLPASGQLPQAPSVLAPTNASVYFRPVLCSIAPATSGASALSGGAAACTSANPTSIESTPPDQENGAATVVLPYFDNHVRYVLGAADLTATDIASAVAVPPEDGLSGYQIELNLTPEGIQAMDRVAAARYPYYEQNPSDPPVQSLEAIEVGGVVQSTPAIEASNFNGSVIISYSGYSMTLDQANSLVQTISQASRS